MNRFHYVFSIAFLTAATAVQAAGPATASATAPAASGVLTAKRPVLPAADYSSPKAAARSFLLAIHAQDSTATRDALTIAPDQKENVDVLLGAMASSDRLVQAVAARFGREGETTFRVEAPAAFDARLKALNEAEPVINGNTATITLAGDEATHEAGGDIMLKKVGGDWKVDAAAYFHLASTAPDATASLLSLARQTTLLTDQATQDVKAGKFASATDAYQKYWARLMDISKSAATAPTVGTAPASQPK